MHFRGIAQFLGATAQFLVGTVRLGRSIARSVAPTAQFVPATARFRPPTAQFITATARLLGAAAQFDPYNARCIRDNGHYEWHLSNVKRLDNPRKPIDRPQPVWFKPS